MKSQPQKQDRSVNFKGTHPEIAKVKAKFSPGGRPVGNLQLTARQNHGKASFTRGTGVCDGSAD